MADPASDNKVAEVTTVGINAGVSSVAIVVNVLDRTVIGACQFKPTQRLINLIKRLNRTF